MVATVATGCGEKPAEDNNGSGTTSGAGGATSDSSNAGDGGSSETVSLRLWGAEEDQDYLQQVVANFEKAYPDQKFNIEIGVESESTAKDTVLTDIEAAADVYSFASDQLADLVRAGALAAIDDVGEVLAKAGKTLDDVKSANAPDSIEAATIDGKMYGFPTGGANTYFLYYDSSVISEEDAKTWDGILAAAAKAKKKVGMTLNSGWYNASFFYGAGFTTGLNEDGTTTMDWNGTSADGISGVDVVKSMLDITSNSAFMPIADGQISKTIASGDLCAVISGAWDSSNAEEVWKDGYSATKLPTYTLGDKQIQMAPAYGYKFEAVNAYSKNTGWAVLLAEFVANEESQKLHFDMKKQPPTNSNVLASDAIQTDKAIAAAVSQGDFGVIQLVGQKYWDTTKTFGEMVAKGKIKAKDDAAIQKALDNLVDGVTAPLS
ncbi:MAG: extracellular solute-binding protein [Lachnospiraceae bacterium]|nr:extracellular solute-binding protein [Lachnospiraceae bacterium]